MDLPDLRTGGSRDSRACENCGTALAGPYCSECGQPAQSPLTSLGTFVRHVLDDVASFDSRLLRTLRTLILHPGRLTAEYLAGRRIRYTYPVQLYFLGAAAFFLVASFRPFLWIDTATRSVQGALPGITSYRGLADSTLSRIAASGMSLDLFAARFGDAVNGWLPAFLVGSIALFSLVLYAFEHRRERRYLPHAVFTLHWTTFYLLITAGIRLLPDTIVLQQVDILGALVYLALALKLVYRQGWPLTLAKAVGIWLVFLIILVVWVQSAVAIGLLVV
jgi:Protein of unknown function (DUF3667)